MDGLPFRVDLLDRGIFSRHRGSRHRLCSLFFHALQVAPSAKIALAVFGITICEISSSGVVAVASIIAFSFVHYHSLLVGSRVQNGLTLFKIGLIVTFVVAGLCFGNGSVSNFSHGLDISSVFQDKFAISLIFVSFAYSGWNAAAYLRGEIERPNRNIPLALFTGTFFVMCLYLLLNVVYIYALPVKVMSRVLEVGTKSAISLFGEDMSKYFSGAIAIGLLSVLSAMVMAGPRVYYAMSRDGVFFGIFGKVNKARRTPAYPIFLQAAIAIIMVITASFDKLLLYIGFTLSLFAMLTVTGMVRLRIRQPALTKSYRTPGYPLTPLLFILGNIWIIYFSIRSRPITSLFGLGTIGLGIVLYWYFAHKNHQGNEI
jgi:APA family basic amino acid/polyamine antiporter